jgi:hypothetical protein
MKPVASMTRSQIIKEMRANSTKQSVLNDKLIAAGYGMVRMSDLRNMMVPEAVEKSALVDRYSDLSAQKDLIYLGYRKATPKTDQT